MTASAKQRLRFALSAVLGAGVLSGVLYFVGWRETLAEMQALGASGIAAVIANVLIPMAAWILCWWIILRSYDIHLPFRKIIGARLSGYAVSYITPTLYFGGEPVRAMMVADKEKAPATRVFATIIVERFLGGLSMIVFILIGGFYAVSSPSIPWSEKRVLVAGIAFVTFWILVGLINFAFNLKWISRAIRLLGRVIRRWRDVLGRAADKVSETEDEVFAAFTRNWKATVLAFAVQTAATYFIYMRPQVFFHFSSGLHFTFLQLSLIFSLNIVLSFFLWITPGGLGTSEAGMIGIFRLILPGISSQGVVAYSLLYKFAEVLLVGAGVYVLLQRGLSYVQRRSSEPLDGGLPEPAADEKPPTVED